MMELYERNHPNVLELARRERDLHGVWYYPTKPQLRKTALFGSHTPMPLTAITRSGLEILPGSEEEFFARMLYQGDYQYQGFFGWPMEMGSELGSGSESQVNRIQMQGADAAGHKITAVAKFLGPYDENEEQLSTMENFILLREAELVFAHTGVRMPQVYGMNGTTLFLEYIPGKTLKEVLTTLDWSISRYQSALTQELHEYTRILGIYIEDHISQFMSQLGFRHLPPNESKSKNPYLSVFKHIDHEEEVVFVNDVHVTGNKKSDASSNWIVNEETEKMVSDILQSNDPYKLARAAKMLFTGMTCVDPIRMIK